MHDAIGNEIKVGDKVLQIYIGRGSCTVHKAKIERIRNTRIYYRVWHGEGNMSPSDGDPRDWGAVEWTSNARVIRYDWM